MLCFNSFGQSNSKESLEGYWIQQPNDQNIRKNTDETIYMYYSKVFAIIIWAYKTPSKIDNYTMYYGFYDDCDLPHIDSLKQSGIYYFAVDKSDFENEQKRAVSMRNACEELNIFTVGNDTLMNIYRSSNQQYITYKKLDSLPQNVHDYLRKKGIRKNLQQKKILSDKAIIYSQPEIPTKMYLIKSNIITVLEEKEGWVKIEYEGKKLITGWVKKEDIKE
jgi:hypothetical protein